MIHSTGSVTGSVCVQQLSHAVFSRYSALSAKYADFFLNPVDPVIAVSHQMDPLLIAGKRLLQGYSVCFHPLNEQFELGKSFLHRELRINPEII